jgi:hypothetical protein
MDLSRELITPTYRDATQTALWVQVALAILSILVLDGGVTARYSGVAMLGFWFGAALIAARRPWAPTINDLRYWRWGFIPVFIAVRVFGTIVWDQ